VFCLYSLILIALGIFGSHTIKNKADGVNVDLWTGLAMLGFGALMIFWALSRPTSRSRPRTARGDRAARRPQVDDESSAGAISARAWRNLLTVKASIPSPLGRRHRLGWCLDLW
jgi:hypothetical protein